MLKQKTKFIAARLPLEFIQKFEKYENEKKQAAELVGTFPPNKQDLIFFAIDYMITNDTFQIK